MLINKGRHLRDVRALSTTQIFPSFHTIPEDSEEHYILVAAVAALSHSLNASSNLGVDPQDPGSPHLAKINSRY